MRVISWTVVVTAVTLAVSCGSPAPSPPPSTSTAPSSGHGAYASCLAENGVPTPPAGPGAPPGIDEQTWATAQKACADEAPGPAGQP